MAHTPLYEPHKLARVLPPSAGPFVSMVIEGRRYSSKGGAPLDVPAEDARILGANGWVLLGPSGPAEVRPKDPLFGASFLDITHDQPLVFDGRVWRDTHTGCEVT